MTYGTAAAGVLQKTTITTSAIRHREPARCRRQYRHRGGRARSSGLYAALCHYSEREQCDALRQAQFQFRPRYRTDRAHRPLSLYPGGESFGSCQDASEFIAYAKANPGKINMASPAIGSTPHLNGEPFKVMTGTNIVHVPYRSAAAVLTDLMSGQVQLYFGTTALSLEYVRTGKLRALGVTIERRLDALPESRPWLISCRATRRTTGKETEDPCQVQHPDGFGRNVHWTVWASLQTWSGSTLDGRATENINAVFKKDEISPWCWTINSQTRLFRRSLSLQRYKGSCVDFLFVEESDAHDQQIHRARQ